MQLFAGRTLEFENREECGASSPCCKSPERPVRSMRTTMPPTAAVCTVGADLKHYVEEWTRHSYSHAAMSPDAAKAPVPSAAGQSVHPPRYYRLCKYRIYNIIQEILTNLI
eukprot:TRINITY_DN2108_c0_g1_i1.p3 TRINITY_DN2108_c0_g1~~TRINITY_DN2108_c0_g1_i1.p3  ORF type:complete len:111 (-),score=0.99 TRINITY_DN2108_c0_g1_i1:2-334(-)